MEDWDSLQNPLSKCTLKTLNRLGFKKMTPVQAACLPMFMQRKDVAAEAVTGSGKTLAFVIPILENIYRLERKLEKHEIAALIISPTRELATQICEVVKEFLEDSDAKLTQRLFVGGNKVEEDNKVFESEGANIIVATPGRIEDLLIGKTAGSNILSDKTVIKGLKSLEILVMDEADRLLSLGFESSINTILQLCPKQRRTGLFSATQTQEISKLIRAGLRNPVMIKVQEKGATKENSRTPVNLDNFYVLCEPQEKFAQLVHFLRKHKQEKVLVFVSTCATVEYFAVILEHLCKGSKIFGLHGKMKNGHNVFENFKKEDSGILLCTDVMARGVDIPLVHWVVQFDPPSNAESFVHRCGRTARIGNEGSAMLMLMPNEEVYINFLKINQKVWMEEKELPKPELDFLPKIRKILKGDRAVFDKSTRAFVSYVRSYSKHECDVLLKVKDLDLGGIASSYGLLSMPFMPETKFTKIKNFVPDPINTKTIPYKDKIREKSRQDKMVKFEETGEWPGAKKREIKTTPWSKKKVEQEKKKINKLNRMEKKKKKEANKKRMTDEEKADLDDFAEEYRLMKKIKRGKAKESDFDSVSKMEELSDVET